MVDIVGYGLDDVYECVNLYTEHYITWTVHSLQVVHSKRLVKYVPSFHFVHWTCSILVLVMSCVQGGEAQREERKHWASFSNSFPPQGPIMNLSLSSSLFFSDTFLAILFSSSNSFSSNPQIITICAGAAINLELSLILSFLPFIQWFMYALSTMPVCWAFGMMWLLGNLLDN